MNKTTHNRKQMVAAVRTAQKYFNQKIKDCELYLHEVTPSDETERWLVTLGYKADACCEDKSYLQFKVDTERNEVVDVDNVAVCV